MANDVAPVVSAPTEPPDLVEIPRETLRRWQETCDTGGGYLVAAQIWRFLSEHRTHPE